MKEKHSSVLDARSVRKQTEESVNMTRNIQNLTEQSVLMTEKIERLTNESVTMTRETERQGKTLMVFTIVTIVFVSFSHNLGIYTILTLKATYVIHGGIFCY